MRLTQGRKLKWLGMLYVTYKDSQRYIKDCAESYRAPEEHTGFYL